MRKDIADEIKTECDNRGDYSQCLKHMSQESLDTYLDNLGFIESIFNSVAHEFSKCHVQLAQFLFQLSAVPAIRLRKHHHLMLRNQVCDKLLMLSGKDAKRFASSGKD